MNKVNEDLQRRENDAFTRYYSAATVPCTQRELDDGMRQEYENAVSELEKVRAEIERRACPCGTE